MKKLLSILLILIAGISCTSQNQTSMSELQEKLEKETYSSLFLSANSKADSLWDEYNLLDLTILLKSKKNDYNIRFLASELLFHKDTTFPNEIILPILGEIYANTLKRSGLSNENDFLPANLWGFLYKSDYQGNLGNRFFQIGTPACIYLVKLLEDNDPVLYIGSQEAMIGNSYKYRIKDFAAFYISKIRNIPITFYPDITERDIEIERFKKLVSKN